MLKKISDEKAIMLSDQGFYALFNFGSIFVLSKLASIDVFGSYVIFLSYVNFGFIFSTFLLSAPILVLLVKKWKHNPRIYLTVILSSNLVISFLLSIICFFFLRYQKETVSFVFVFLAPLLMATFDILKKFLFSLKTITLFHALFASLILNLSFFSGIFIFKNQLNLQIILSIFTGSFLVATLYIIFWLFKKSMLSFSRFSEQAAIAQSFKLIVSQHYKYSKWIILGGIAFWGYSQGLFIMSKSLMVDNFGIGKVRTVQNIWGVINIVIVSFENYYIPYFSNFTSKESNVLLSSLVNDLYKKYYKLVIILFISVFPVAVVFYKIVYEVKYDSGLFLLIVFAFTQLLLLAIRPLIIALKAEEITYPFFLAHIAAATTMVLFGSYFIGKFGYNAMAVTFLVSNISFSLIVGYFYRLKINKN